MRNMKILEQKKTKEYVIQDLRTVTLFSKYGIDFCCNENISIESDEEKKSNQNNIPKQIETILNTEDDSKIDFDAMPIDILADFIQRKHHNYVTHKTQILLPFLNELCTAHGTEHPELLEINELFIDTAAEMKTHMKKEENYLFPYIKNMVNAVIIDALIEQQPFEIIQSLTELIQSEHASEGESFKKITALSNNFTPPSDACSMYKVTFELLKDFKEDLQKHIHLENNILFPKAILLEKEYTTQLQSI